MVHDLLRDFQLTAVLQIRRDVGRAEGMIADARLDAGRLRAPADDAMGVLLGEGIGCQLSALSAGAAEEIAVDIIGDTGRFNVLVQTLIEATFMRPKYQGNLGAPRRMRKERSAGGGGLTGRKSFLPERIKITAMAKPVSEARGFELRPARSRSCGDDPP